MKVKLEIDPAAEETEVVIKAKSISPEIKQLYQSLQKKQHANEIECFKNHVSYYLPIDDILFFETDAKQVMVHTKNQAYLVKYKLYELENLLGTGFMRISKSTIVNLDNIYGLTRSISNCKIQFHDSYKTIYASRRYYKDLCQRLNERRF